MSNKQTDKTKDKKHDGQGITPPSYGSPETDKMNKGAGVGSKVNLPEQ